MAMDPTSGVAEAARIVAGFKRDGVVQVILTPFAKMLYSSDAFGLPELYYLSALVFRRELAGLLESRVTAGEWAAADAIRIAQMIGSGNAARTYGLG